jgi:hypothetical protein
VTRSLDDCTATTARLGLPDFLLCSLRCGSPPRSHRGDARDRAAEQLIEETGERYSHAPVLRAKGDVFLALDHGEPARAEQCFREAIAVGHEQGSRLPELRAAVSLMRLRCDWGDVGDACDGLEACVAAFAGSDIDDEGRARTLLTGG